MPTTAEPIRDRILSTIDHLFDAFDSGSFDIVTTHWAQVGGEIRTSSPNSNTHVAASCIDELCNAFTSFTHLSANLEHRLSEYLTQPPKDDTSSPPNPPTANHPPYVKPASEWLLDNLHNPFPPAKYRDHLSAAHGCPRKNIDTWFNEARKRIGWNTMRKRCFGSRKEMVDAASSFFLDHATSGEFDNEFLRMSVKAKDLYSKRLVKSELMQKLDRSVKPMSDEVKRQADEESRERQLEKRRVSYRSDDKAATPPTLVARKKCRSHHDDEDDQPSRKRLRSHSGCDDDDDNSSSSGSSSRRASSLFSEAPSEFSSATEASSPSSTTGSVDSSREHRLKRPRISSAPTTPMNLPKSPAENRLTQTQTQLSSDVPSESSKSTSATEVPSPSVTSGKRRSSDSSHERRRKRPRISSAPTPMTVPTFPAEEDWFTLTQAQTQLPTDVEYSCDISSWLASMDSLSDADSSCVTTPTHLLHNDPLPHIDQGNSLLELDNSIAAASPLLPTNTTDLSDLCQMTFPEYYYTLSDPFGFDFPEFDISSTLASPYPVYHAGVVA
ncbi:hypothetical protein E1B28_001420 [Marasmius oreades]|uniref:Uncharacterized protein n=1 Tax=Marasmius oreades TaxID=181124 RepID=A0A9P7V3E6_9AGAR|nr:uncharacterized protein E1B28_001420 [Marasmius oreades]KAG7099590.1 hypothetical protein E1B28_001420 [Marasmius oreades]